MHVDTQGAIYSRMCSTKTTEGEHCHNVRGKLTAVGVKKKKCGSLERCTLELITATKGQLVCFFFPNSVSIDFRWVMTYVYFLFIWKQGEWEKERDACRKALPGLKPGDVTVIWNPPPEGELAPLQLSAPWPRLSLSLPPLIAQWHSFISVDLIQRKQH